MEFDLWDMVLPDGFSSRVLKAEILRTNQQSGEYGLLLTEKDVDMLLATNRDSLQNQQRIEIGESILIKLIEKFMRSQFLSQSDYGETLATLLDIFYEAKEESNDILTDDEVLDMMFYYFEEVSCGSIELLQTRDMDSMCRSIRDGSLRLEDEEEY